jgi:peptidoglycan DL-endopeptidase CwlO
MIMAIIATTIAPPPAFADAVSDKKAQAAALAEKINSDDLQVQVLDNQYDGARYHLGQVEQQMATAKQQLQVAQVNDQRSRAALANEAVVAYMDGGVTGAPSMSSYSGSDDLSVEEGYYQLAVGRQTDALDQYRTSEVVLHQQQITLQSAQSASQAAVANVTSQKQAVEAASAATQTVLNQVQGQLVQLVAEQQAQIAAQQAAQVKAQLLAAAQAAQAGAARAAAATAPRASSNQSKQSNQSNQSNQSASSNTAASVASVARSDSLLPAGPIPAPSSGAAAAIAYARAQIGKPYQWGASGPGSFDCSGLTMMAWAAGGVSLPHFSGAQYADTAHIPIADLEPGDLVFFGSDIHHVGLYIGNGQMIDAPDTGSFVRVDSIFWSDLDPDGGRP